ncbi:glycosyltransferase family 48 protein [Sphaerobolus stellatus SS14]|uniref:1,3-beta-glucan synthase n=1 Tax=Sphaerobolus stellatus (strain SS14) TaxID=990650 RepID=A0A0C9TN25_SPHS4|nr:glycosyltransferase family 48 protein [Sphaerobolus stellatus SS14]
MTDFQTARLREPYPAWSNDRQIPLSKEEIEDIFLDLTQKFGFQKDSMRNMFDFLMQLLDSRASRMTPNQALLTLHADYIGGHHANYRKWYFAAQLDLDDAVGESQNPGLQRLRSVRSTARGAPRNRVEKSLHSAQDRWRAAMNQMSQYDRLRQLALYLLLWGEAAQVRFVPECLCFIFKCADDYYRSAECQDRTDHMPEGLYLHTVTKPLYRFIRDQGYEVVENRFVRRERDHDQIIGYDDVNQLFWYPEGLARIVLSDKTRLIDLPPSKRFLAFEHIDWSKVFYKTYTEKRSFLHLIVNFNRIWVIHIAFYWFYTAFNSPTAYRPNPESLPTAALTWSVTALGGAVATVIMIMATVLEFIYIPTTWSNAGHLLRRLAFLLVVLALTAGPTIYIAIAGGDSSNQLALILGIVQFFISVVATILFAIIPSGRMFGDRVAGKSRKYLASQTFTASYAPMKKSARAASICLWLLVFGCKLTESYFFLTLSFRDPIRVMVGMKVQGCNDKYFGSALCRNQAAFTLTIMYIMDLVLFFLDTFLWWVIWNTVFSIARSFALGLSIWTPWPDIFARLPKRIYAKLLATGDMETKYKPKVLVSQIWNAIIISMYREHLLSIDHVQRLLYHQVQSESDGRRILRAPPFFISQTDKSFKGEFFPPGSEAERRISFFAQSLTTAIPEPLPVDAMPTYTVLTPHYSEKILLSLREIIKEEDQNIRDFAAKHPVAIVGAREYIFSENIGILGDVAAGKEQTFGTLAARTLSWIGGKLHYGHPDFLNGIYMNTRGGVSKAQKGLHLNEDIYAGMNAFGRGGRIKHSEYYQCGKGRDLGFGTILNFQTKIGTGMGEQMLSREYYYLGTQLPIDRFLTFYYGHPGFHINNVLVIGSVQVFMVALVYLGTMNKQLPICKYDKQGNFIGGQQGCYNLVPVFDWIKRCIISIFLVFFISFLPLFMQELTERGSVKAVTRLSRHFLSLSPVFEVFSTQIQTHSILSNLNFGGARYIATGRGFATARISFSILYSRFAGPAIYLGMRTLIMLLYVTMSLWIDHLIYFWISVLALCVAPFLFNPHQFSWPDFIVDYREFLRWMSRGNSRTHANSWIGYCRLSRTMITGYKKKRLGHPSEKLSGDVPRAGWRTVFFSEIIFPIFMAVLFIIAYAFVKSFPQPDGTQPASPFVRIAIISLGPLVWNAAILIVLFLTSVFLGPMLDTCCAKFGAVMASIAHFLAVVGMVGFFEFLWFLELWDASHAVLGLIAVIFIQRAIHKILIAVFLSREFKHDETNRAWWTGKWYGRGLGRHILSQPAREFVVKIIELSLWSSDFLLGHLLLFMLTPPMLIPFVDQLHATILVWLRPSKQIHPPVYSLKQRRQRRSIAFRYGTLYFLVLAAFVLLIALPAAFRGRITPHCSFCSSI